MANKLTVKQERFIAAYIETGNASEAYRRSYDCAPDCKPNTIEKRACELLQNRKVTGRLAELHERAAAQVVLSRAWVLERLMRNADAAVKSKDFTASNKALELLGKVDELSMFVERSDVTSNNQHHHKAEPVSATAAWAAGLIGSGADRASEESLPN